MSWSCVLPVNEVQFQQLKFNTLEEVEVDSHIDIPDNFLDSPSSPWKPRLLIHRLNITGSFAFVLAWEAVVPVMPRCTLTRPSTNSADDVSLANHRTDSVPRLAVIIQ